MESLSLTFLPPALVNSQHHKTPTIIHTKRSRNHRWSATGKSPRGFGAPPEKTKSKKLKTTTPSKSNEEEDDDDEIAVSDVTIPEIVTNRMLKRMGVSIGAPLAIGLMFFPFFYYLKVVANVDLPSWIPFVVSFVFFGAALAGISYGIVSASWDPAREGSFLGWNEARRNFPVFWESLWGGKKRM